MSGYLCLNVKILLIIYLIIIEILHKVYTKENLAPATAIYVMFVCCVRCLQANKVVYIKKKKNSAHLTS